MGLTPARRTRGIARRGKRSTQHSARPPQLAPSSTTALNEPTRGNPARRRMCLDDGHRQGSAALPSALASRLLPRPGSCPPRNFAGPAASVSRPSLNSCGGRPRRVRAAREMRPQPDGLDIGDGGRTSPLVLDLSDMMMVGSKLGQARPADRPRRARAFRRPLRLWIPADRLSGFLSCR